MGSDEPTDEALAVRASAGDGAAFEALVARYQDRLSSAAARRLPPALRGRVSSSDVAQECLVAAHGRIADFEDRGPGSFGRWVRRILAHKVRDEIRDHLVRDRRDANREVRRDSHQDGQPFADEAPSPGAMLQGKEQHALVRAALASLPEAQQTILRLVHDGGLTAGVAGEQMGRSGEAGRKLYARSVAALARALRAGKEGS